MYFSGKQLGDMLTLLLWSRNTAGTPVAPDAAPVAEIWSDGDLIERFSLPAVPGTSGKIFLYNLFLGDISYVPGKYFVRYTWELSTVIQTKMDVFEIVAGGDYDGVGISMHFLRQPAGDFVLVQGMSGRVLRLKNPSL